MEIFLPSEEAAAVKIGAEGRITVDYDKDRAVAGNVSFVSPEAQFTPKQVETKSEREKLMFRVKIQVPKDVAGQYIERIKTGVRGVGYVKIDDNAVWPARLQNLVAPVRSAAARCPHRDLCKRRSSPSRASPTATARWWRWTTSPWTSPRGIMVGIVGPDGVGKSTLMALVAGSKKLQEGKVTVLDGDIGDARTGGRSARGSPTCPRAWARTCISS